MKSTVLGLIMIAHLFSGCVTRSSDNAVAASGPMRCKDLAGQVNWSDQVGSLNKVSELFRSGCYQETIDIGTEAKERFRHKTYSTIKETVELFIPEGTVTDYVLESYERGYLTFLIAASYMHLNQTQAVTVELNRFYNEETALIYNYGQDPVNALIQASMWENIPRPGFSARPFWAWLTKAPSIDAKLRKFAEARVQDIDAKKPNPTWRISEIGHFPDLAWSMKFIDSTAGYIKVRPSRSFLETCVDSKGIIVPTTTWFNKIAMRHSHSYHPLVNAKSWIRLPFGAIYGVSTIAAGAGIAVGGCAVDFGTKGDGALCKLSIYGGAALMAKSGDVIDYTLQPDLRHWEKLPEAILITSDESSEKTECLNRDDFEIRRVL